MKSALRKMGNSTGMILPLAILAQAGLAVGAQMDLTVEDGRLVATPILPTLRQGWAQAAQLLGDPSETDEWNGFGNEDDATLTW